MIGCVANKLKLNFDKYKFLVLRAKWNCNEFSSCNYNVCMNVNEVKYLGAILDQQSTFEIFQIIYVGNWEKK